MAQDPGKRGDVQKPRAAGEGAAYKCRPLSGREGGAPPARRRCAAGNFLYSLGFAGEYFAVGAARGARNGALFLWQMLAMLLGAVWGWLSALLQEVWRDVTAPFRRFARRRKQLKRVRAVLRREMQSPRDFSPFFTRVVLKSVAQFLLHILIFIGPLAAAAVLVFTVTALTGRTYALEVRLNGRLLGYVSDKSVVEEAKSLVREQISLAPNQSLADWQPAPTYTIAQVNRLTTAGELYNRLIRSASVGEEGAVVQATGLYVDGRLFAATTEGDALRDYLDGRLAAFAVTGGRAVFEREVFCDEPDADRLYLAQAVMDYGELVGELSRNVTQELRVEAAGDETLEEIARNNGITSDELRRRNPDYAAQAAGFVPQAGAVLLVQRPQPFLQVQTVYRSRTEEPIPFAQEEIYNAEAARGTLRVVRQGVQGRMEIWEDVYYIDGERVKSERVEDLSRVLQEAVTQIVERGTYEFGTAQSGEFGEYFFPVPASTWSSRGIGGHSGQDINAPDGTPMFACNAGRVITAGWHYSYGWYTVIEHPDGMKTLYGHCSSLAVEQGQNVSRGEYIGAMGSTGNSTGPHLHLEFISPQGENLDPLDFITPPEGYSFGRPPA